MTVPHDFAFAPLQHVVVTAYDLNVKGRVVRCILSNSGATYDVEYCVNSEFKRMEFYADQLRSAGAL
jgi:hypothetical protein